jgi:ATP-dependent helicase YprA (DUF1998 family)
MPCPYKRQMASFSSQFTVLSLRPLRHCAKFSSSLPHDHMPGGIGIARRCFSVDERLFAEARHLAETCGCKSGCPACTGPQLETGDRPREAVARLLRGF